MTYMSFGDWQVYDEEGRRKYVNASEFVAVLAAADRTAPNIRVLCYLLAYSGCRISEAISLTPNHIDRERGALIVRTLKRRKLVFRLIPIPDALMTMLLDLPLDDAGLFFPIHRTTAYRQIKLVMSIAKVSGPRACPKGLRHGFGMRCASKSIPPNLIQRFMGHASGATTAIYLDATSGDERLFASRLW